MERHSPIGPSYLKVEESDAEELANWLSSDNWPFFIGNKLTSSEVLDRIKQGAFFGEGEENFWVILNDQKIGLIELYELNELAPMFSIRLLEKHRGKGLGRPCLEWLTAYIFENYPDKGRIEGQTREDNVVMRRLFNKCGYMKEAYYRLASPTDDGGRVASVAYGILREDWETGKLTPIGWNKDNYFSDDRF